MNQRFCNGMIHVIRSGDNLYQLSRRYRVPLALILRANPYVDVYNLRPGQEICIPMPCGSGPIAGRGMQQENVETTEQETDDEEYEEEQTAQSEEEKEVSCVYRADGTKSLGAILNECGMTMAEFFEKNNPEQIIIAADVLFAKEGLTKVIRTFIMKTNWSDSAMPCFRGIAVVFERKVNKHDFHLQNHRRRYGGA